MRICLIEATSNYEYRGSIGAFYVRRALEKKGYPVDVLPYNSNRFGYDVELVSVHHQNDFTILCNMPKRGRIRLVGGHVTYSNPRPLIPFSDAICVGDGESWVVNVLSKLKVQLQDDALLGLSGTIVPKIWKKGDPLPQSNYDDINSEVEPYLNRKDELSASWYIEIARGCPFSCYYCELGNSMPYRWRSFETVKLALSKCDRLKAKNVTFFAPDGASYPYYKEILDYAKSLGFRQRFGSYRIDTFSPACQDIDRGQLIRVGIDGLTEITRKRVNKPISNAKIISFFQSAVSNGFHNFKIFQMFGHQWEKVGDLDEWFHVLDEIVSVGGKKRISLRIKWTPFIPQNGTPLERHSMYSDYNPAIAKCIRAWHNRNGTKGEWDIYMDGMMSQKTWWKQVEAARGDELFVFRKHEHPPKGYVNEKWRDNL